MKKMLLALAVALVPTFAMAQSASFAGRASVTADYKIVKGLHLSVGEEIRSNDNFSALGSLRTTVGLTYKPIPYLRIGAGYTLINPWKNGKEIELSDESTTKYYGFWAPKHRFNADVTGMLRLGGFQLSLRERVQLDHNGDSDMNIYQDPRNKVALRSRLGVKYKGWKMVQPYAHFEIRTQLNGAWGSTSGSQQTKKDGVTTYYDYTPAGYTHVYNDRYRGELGVDLNFGKHHTLNPYLLLDYLSEYEIDTNKKGTRLYSAAYTNLFRVSLGLAYTFNF